ncbi:MAG: acyl-CoA dehydrogenase family protein [Thermoguttaceae bacterium]|nr:acyl-CoA dehydrogenase family protein [Thermoguttaceae bacterium]MBQ5366206.1 acyl-CoA dehydrogenase family protein [Thermoguttaceae bacterium]
MANFYTDNQDIQFLFDYFDLKDIAAIQERETPNGDADYLPRDIDDAIDNYRRVLEIVGDISGNVLAKNAETVDAEGNTLNENQTVTLHPLVQKNLDQMSLADLQGFTLPRKYGGINCPTLVYTMATEIVARGDCSFMNMFGLQGIAETIYAFASDEIKDEYLPKFARGEVTGAMVLTEPDAGSDLQAVRVRAYQNENGDWFLSGVKRFITNGCGEVLLVLARSEAQISDGRGLSLFVCDRGPTVKVRHLENKLGIHGSPTCELVFNNTPCRLIGERQRGLITYVMSLMNGARLGIAAQSLGVAEAAQRLARDYANSREQFGAPIEHLPAVAEMVVDMRVRIEAARALCYETARVCDYENNINRLLERNADSLSAEEKKEFKQKSRSLKKLNAMLTPMSKFFCSEMSISVATDAIQVLGGSGYMKDYAAERYYRDARITTIYEGTSQLQVVAAIRGLTSGVYKSYVEEFENKEFGDETLDALKSKLVTAHAKLTDALTFAREKGSAYVELRARKMVEAGIAILIGHYLLAQAAKNDRKKKVADYYITKSLSEVAAVVATIQNGSTHVLDDYLEFVGPVSETK